MAASTYLNQVQQLYIAYFGRPADPVGQQYWAHVIDSAGGNISSVLDGFSASAESLALYGASNTAQKVAAIYSNLFNRAPEAAGLAYWVNQIDSGEITQAQAAWTIQQAAGPDDARAVNNKLIAANVFTANLDTDAEIAGFNGSNSTALARAFLNKVDASYASIADVNTYAATYVALATGTATAVTPPPVAPPAVIDPRASEFVATVTAGSVAFSGIAKGDISVTWSGIVGASDATFTRGGGVSNAVTFGGTGASSITLASTDTLVGNASTLAGLTTHGAGGVTLTDSLPNLAGKVFSANSSQDVLIVTSPATTPASLANLLGFETVYLAGSDDNMTITIADGANTAVDTSASVSVQLGAGGQTFVGSVGDDIIETGAGNYTLSGNSGRDTFNIAAASTNTITDLSTGDTLVVAATGTVTAVEVVGFTASAATTNNGTVTINTAVTDAVIDLSQAQGATGFSVVAQSGKDKITGSAKADTLTGGGGGDTFIFDASNRSTLAAMDTITDFRPADGDIIDIRDITTIASNLSTVQDLNGLTSLERALNAITDDAVINNGLVVFIWDKNTYVYIETTGSANAYVAGDTVIKLTGMPFSAGQSINNLGIDGV